MRKFSLFVYSLALESGIKKILIWIYFWWLWIFTNARVGIIRVEFLPTPELELFAIEYSLAPESGIL
jgi:hypothetical protein